MIQHTIQSGGGRIPRLALLLATFIGTTAVAPAEEFIGFNEAVGSTALAWSTGGDSAWFVEEDEAFSNGYALRSGPLGDSQESWVELETEGPARLRFRMKHDTERNNDVVSVSVWEAATRRTHTIRSGFQDWDTYSINLTDPISNRVRWTYTKNESESVGEDAVWIDDVDLTVFDYDWSVIRQIPPLSGHATVYDEARDRHVLFGGSPSYNSPLNLTFEFNGRYWQRMSPASSPAARHYHGMVYDPVRRKTLLFGGEGRNSSHNLTVFQDFLEYDGASWREIETATVPTPRYGHAMVYDPDRDRVVLFGGFDTAALNDTWEFDGSNWSPVSTATSPSPRMGHRMVYDSTRKKIVLFGGRIQKAGSPPNSQTWEYDGTDWVQINSPITPPETYDPGMAYDPVREQIILVDKDIWHYGADGWQLVDDEPIFPYYGGRTLTYNTRDNTLMFYGGQSAGFILLSTWVYRDGTWVERRQGPKTGHYSQAVHDPVRNRVILFGSPSENRPGADTWEFDGIGWEAKSQLVSPGPRRGHAMVWDSTAENVFLFGGSGSGNGGYSSDTWVYDGENWTQLTPEGDPPPPRAMHAMAHDPIRKKTVMFGGEGVGVGGQTWEWDGMKWTEIITENSPGPRQYHGMLYDPRRGAVILLGGVSAGQSPFGPFAEVWEFDGMDWSIVPSYRLPEGLQGFGHAIHPESGEIVVVGRSPLNSFRIVTRIFDGESWNDIDTLLAVSGPPGSPLSYSPADDSFVYCSGEDTVSYRLTKVDRSPPPTPTPTPTPSPSPSPTPTVTTAVPTTSTPTITVTATPSPTETSTPVPTTNVPTATATATATPSPTPTATTPVATPTVTPISPELVEALSSLTAENWNPVTVPEVYAEPGLEVLENRLLLNTVSNNSFGFHTTREPIGPLGAGRYHLLASIVPTGELPIGGAFPELRLRVTGENGLVNFLRADASTGSATEARSASTYFIGSQDGMFGVSVDILRFIENQAGGYAVTAFQLEPVAGAAATVESPALEIVEGNWASTAFDGIFASPEFMQTGEGLLVSTNAAGTFGFWSSTNTLGPLEPGLYELVATVEPQGELVGGEFYPELRLRVTGNAGLVSVLRADASTGASTGPRELSVLFEATSDADTFGVAVDILRFLDSQRGGYLITDFVLKQIE